MAQRCGAYSAQRAEILTRCGPRLIGFDSVAGAGLGKQSPRVALTVAPWRRTGHSAGRSASRGSVSLTSSWARGHRSSGSTARPFPRTCGGTSPASWPANGKVVLLDLLGYGQSEMRPGQDVSLGVQNRVLAALLRHLGLARPDVIGHDFGVTCRLSPDLIALRRWLAPGSWLITSV